MDIEFITTPMEETTDQMAVSFAKSIIPSETLEVGSDAIENQIPTPSPPSDQPDMPFIYRPYLSGTVCQLLSIEEQYPNLPAPTNELWEVIAHAMRTIILFPSSLEVYEYRSAADPQHSKYWTRRATIDGVELEPSAYPSPYFVQQCGITGWDNRYLAEAVKKGYSAKSVWV